MSEEGAGPNDVLSGPGDSALGEHLRILEALWHGAAEQASGILVDVDRFQQVGDGWGHAAGTAVLAAVADAVRHCAGPDDTVARLGGDAFLVLLPGTDLAGAEALAERVRRRVEVKPVPVTGATLTVTVSVGCGQGLHGGGADLLARAVAALATAKDGGRNRVETSPPVA